MTKKLKTTLLAVFLAAVFIAFAFGGICLGFYISHDSKLDRYDFSALIGASNKTVLFIGDGMGFNHISVTENYFERETYFEAFEISGQISTFSNVLLGPTDSAAAGSALSTGKKYNNGEVARHNKKDIESISEYAKSLGLGVGIVTTDNLSGATPASFSAHANNRGDTDDIINGQVNSNIDLFLGAGLSTYSEHRAEFEANGYTFCQEYETLETNINKTKLIASFSAVGHSEPTSSEPTLDMLTDFALNFMELHYSDGYFLMIEGAHIDKCSHKNDIVGMVNYLKNFDESIELAHNKLKAEANAAIIVTADHETGGLKFNGESKDKINDNLYTRNWHSTKDVPYYIFLKTQKTIDAKTIFNKEMDNTDIFKIMHAMLTKETNAA